VKYYLGSFIYICKTQYIFVTLHIFDLHIAFCLFVSGVSFAKQIEFVCKMLDFLTPY